MNETPNRLRSTILTTCLPAICFVIALAGCGSGISGPTTQYTWMGIGATLPGKDWHELSKGTQGSLTVDTWEKADHSMMFRVSTNPDETLDTSRVQSSAVDEYMSLMAYPDTSLVDSVAYRGRRAVRLESVSLDKDTYHMVEYVFVRAFRHYFVGAGAKNANWDSGGKDTVDAILDNTELDK
jgi:hypothetical protein